MRRLRMDFAMNRGHEMTIDREGGIGRSELDELELQMLRAQRIPYLLPIDWYEIDGSITFRYELTGSKMMIHRLQQDMLTMEQYYSLILALTDALLECKEYMLRPEGCLLSEQFMFMGERFGDLRLVYLPLKDEGEGRQYGEDLLSLAVRWTSYVEPIDGVGLKRILQLLQHNRTSLTELRETLLDLIAKESTVIDRPAVVQDTAARHSSDRNARAVLGSANDSVYSNRMQVKPSIPELVPPLSSLSASPSQQAGIHPQESMSIMQNRRSEENLQSGHDSELEPAWLYDDDGEEDSEGKNRGIWIAGAAFLLATACIWRFIYLNQPTQQNMLICSGLTLFALAGVIIVRKNGTSLLMKKKDPLETKEDFEPYSSVLPSRFSWSKPQPAEASDPLPNTTNSMGSYSVAISKPAPSSDARHSLPPTTLLGTSHDSSQKTAMLGSSARSAWLSRTWNGKEEQIALTADLFKIGRSGDGVGYADHADGISRIHVEIERIDGKHHVKDLGSRNGSLLNGKLMVPYKAYKLEFGDRIHLAGDKGPLYELKTG
ncbi:DUF6382 domain-containing protein [Paenibacillus paeoniae]|nr:DUF6382 domain-containing protein [Paenibacillus paeoniae]